MSPSDIASHNGRLALELLRRHGPQTRGELATRLGLTEPAIAGIMTRLMDAGFVDQRKRLGSGRYVSREYRIVPEGAFAIGVHWLPSGGQAVLLDLSMTVVEKKDFKTWDDAHSVCRSFLSHDRIAAACRGTCMSLPEGVEISFPASPKRKTIDQMEAAIVAERVLGVGDRDGGLVVLLINETVKAGLLIGGRTFRGEHGRAGEIGSMATGPDRVALRDVLNVEHFRRSVEQGSGPYAEREQQWAVSAADHLKDAIIAISGFLSPGLILVAGDLPQTALQRMVETVNRETRSFIASFSVPDVAVATFPEGGMAEGAAASIFVGDLFPELSQMPLSFAGHDGG
jgi:DNA-binding transcriptional ArsR family regulator